MRFSKTRVKKYHGEIRPGEKREKRTSDETVDRVLALTRRTRRSRGRKYEGDDEGRRGSKKDDLAWTADQTAPADNLFFLTFRSNADFLSFSSSLSVSLFLRCLFLVSITPDFFTWFRSRCVPPLCLELVWILSTEHRLECFKTVSQIAWHSRDATDYFAKGGTLLRKEKDMKLYYVAWDHTRIIVQMLKC